MEDIAEQSPEQLRRTMHGAPLWARAATVAAGPVFNFIMSILVFGLIVLLASIIIFPGPRGEGEEVMTKGGGVAVISRLRVVRPSPSGVSKRSDVASPPQLHSRHVTRAPRTDAV